MRVDNGGLGTGRGPSAPPAMRRREAALIEPVSVRSIRSRDGAVAAWAATGAGPRTLVVVSGWVTHLTADWSSSYVGRLHRGLAQAFRVLRYDRPGTGMSDRRIHDFSLAGEIDILDRVLAAAGERRVTLFGAGFAGPVAVAYATRHPERVERLVLADTSAHIASTGDGDHGLHAPTVEALAHLATVNWGLGARILSEVLLPDAALDQHRWFTDYQRGGAPPDVAAAMLRALPELDVRLLLGAVRVPTLVVHRRDDSVIGVSAGEALAAGIEGSTFAVLRGTDFVPWMGDVPALVRHVVRFASPPAENELTVRELEVMHLVARGLTNRAIGRWLGITETTVARHLANVYLKLDARGRIDALERLRALGVDPLTASQPGQPSSDVPVRSLPRRRSAERSA